MNLDNVQAVLILGIFAVAIVTGVLLALGVF